MICEIDSEFFSYLQKSFASLNELSLIDRSQTINLSEYTLLEEESCWKGRSSAKFECGNCQSKWSAYSVIFKYIYDLYELNLSSSSDTQKLCIQVQLKTYGQKCLYCGGNGKMSLLKEQLENLSIQFREFLQEEYLGRNEKNDSFSLSNDDEEKNYHLHFTNNIYSSFEHLEQQLEKRKLSNEKECESSILKEKNEEGPHLRSEPSTTQNSFFKYSPNCSHNEIMKHQNSYELGESELDFENSESENDDELLDEIEQILKYKRISNSQQIME